MADKNPFREGQVLTGSLFHEPMRVETVRSVGPGSWITGFVGHQTGQFRRVTITDEELKNLVILDGSSNYSGDGQLLHRNPWHEVKKVQHYWQEINAMTQPMTARENPAPAYGGKEQ